MGRPGHGLRVLGVDGAVELAMAGAAKEQRLARSAQSAALKPRVESLFSNTQRAEPPGVRELAKKRQTVGGTAAAAAGAEGRGEEAAEDSGGGLSFVSRAIGSARDIVDLLGDGGGGGGGAGGAGFDGSAGGGGGGGGGTGGCEEKGVALVGLHACGRLGHRRHCHAL